MQQRRKGCCLDDCCEDCVLCGLFRHVLPSLVWRSEAEMWAREFRKQLVVEIGQQIAQRLHPVAEAVFGVVADEVRTVERRSSVAEGCKQHHGNECLILHGLPFTQGVAQYHSWCACTAHIYPKRKYATAKKGLVFNVDDARNTLRLTRHFEQEYNKGRLMLLPKPSDDDRQKVEQGEVLTQYRLEIHVENGLREEVVKRLYYDKSGAKVDAGPLLVSDGSDGWRELKFGELHEQSFLAARVWMRALFEKARMAYEEHNCLPNPEEAENIERFKCLCSSWQPYWVGRCFQEVGQSPAVMEVEHNERASQDIVEEDDNILAHRNRSDFCDLRLRCPSRTPEIAAISETRESNAALRFKGAMESH